jgi:hypothetical protein
LNAVAGLMGLLLYYSRLVEGPAVRFAPLPQLLVPSDYELSYAGPVAMIYKLPDPV